MYIHTHTFLHILTHLFFSSFIEMELTYNIVLVKDAQHKYLYITKRLPQ